MWAELGSVWRDVMHDPDQAAHLLGKLINHVGPKRVCWGTDSLWYGSPQSEIVALRRFEFTERGKELYNLPYGLEGDVEDPTRKAPNPSRTIRNGIFGRNVAPAYRFDPDAQARGDRLRRRRRRSRTRATSRTPGDRARVDAAGQQPAARAAHRRDAIKSIYSGPVVAVEAATRTD